MKGVTVTQVVYRDPRKLSDHPENRKTYGDCADDDFVESIRDRGIDDPLHVLTDGTIISGHRRKDAALKVGMASVPCIVKDNIDPGDWLQTTEALLAANKYRHKNNEQRAAEFELNKTIEAEKAKRRQIASQNNDAGRAVPENFPELADKGDARDKAAEAVGWSGRTGEKAAKVKAAIDAAEAKGDSDRASALRRALVASVDRAYKMLDKKPRKKKPAKPKAAATTQQLIGDDDGSPAAEPVQAKEDDPDDRIGSLIDQLNFWTAKRSKAYPSASHYTAMMDAIDVVSSCWHQWVDDTK